METREVQGMRRRGMTLVLSLLAVIAVAAVGCTGDGSGGPNPDQHLRIRLPASPATFDPQIAAAAEEITVVKQLFRGLFTYDRNLNVVPAVAREVPTKENGGITADGLTYTIKLRDDARWGDGAPVTAADFVYAFQRLFNPEAGATGYYYSFYGAIAGSTECTEGTAPCEDVGVTALDTYTVQFVLTRPQPTLPTLLALWPASPMRRDLIDLHGPAWTDVGSLTGNGPFRLAAYIPNDTIELRRNEQYRGDDQPTLTRITYRIIEEDSAALIAYDNDEVDMTAIPAAEAANRQGDPEQVRYAQLETYALHYNTLAPPFDNPLVRQAFSRAIDRNAYVRVVQGGVGAPALSWLPPGMPGANAAVGQEEDFDPESARALLAQAFPEGEQVPEVTFTVAETESNRLTAQFVQEQLRQNLGIEVEIETLEQGLYDERFVSGDFQVAWQSWFADYADPENWLPEYFGTDAGFNVLGYSNPAVDDLFAQAGAELDQTARLSLYDQAHAIIIADQAVTPIYHPERNYLVRAEFEGLTTTGLDAEPGDWFFTSIVRGRGSA